MYYQLLTLHSIARWLVLITLVVSVIAAFKGLTDGRPFSRKDNALRHWTATTAHIQLMIGMILYTQSPVVKYFWKNTRAASSFDITFYSAIHAALMLSAIVVLTIGSALAKRRSTDKDKFRTMLIWFSIALIIILLAIPWPFSPLSARPYLRTF